MSADVEVFQFPETGQQIRTVVINGEPWFVAADVAASLGYRMASDATRLLDEIEKGTHEMRTLGGTQVVSIVSEAGLYRLVMRSNKTDAVRFQMWIAHEVLPSISRAGFYSVAPHALPTSYSQALRELASTVERAETAERELAAAEPKVAGYDRLMVADGAMRVGQVAKLLGWQETALRGFLIEERLIFVRQALCGARQYEPYAHFAPHFRPVETVVTHRFGDCAHFTLTVEQRGIDLIRKRIADRKAAVARELAAT